MDTCVLCVVVPPWPLPHPASFVWHSLDLPIWGKEAGDGWLDGGSPWYDTYKTSDDRYMAVGAIEPQFYAAFVKGWIYHAIIHI